MCKIGGGSDFLALALDNLSKDVRALETARCAYRDYCHEREQNRPLTPDALRRENNKEAGLRANLGNAERWILNDAANIVKEWEREKILGHIQECAGME